MVVKRLAIVERGKGKHNFSCFATEDVGTYALMGYGGSAREAMADIKNLAIEYKALAAERGEEFPDVEFDFRFDVGAFFDYYPLDVTAAAKYIGINPSVLRQYATALRVPKQGQINKIREGLSKLASDLGTGLLIEQPTMSYIR